MKIHIAMTAKITNTTNTGTIYAALSAVMSEEKAQRPHMTNRVWPLKIMSPLVLNEKGLRMKLYVRSTAFWKVSASTFRKPGVGEGPARDDQGYRLVGLSGLGSERCVMQKVRGRKKPVRPMRRRR